jgi:predicted O-linked N-acetylglucosamine transferase (SPINDLY family)
MTNDDLPKQTEHPATDTVLQQALAHQQAGEFQQAGELYLSILQTDPQHAEANHNMGVLAVQMEQPAASLAYFIAALDADPTRGQYWLNYIDALFRAGQQDDARQVLALARQQGLEGDAVEALAQRIDAAPPAAAPAPIAMEPPAAQSASRAKSPAANRPPAKHAAHKGRAPSAQEINALITLFTSGRLQEALPAAQAMTERFPAHEFGWKALGAIYKQMGRAPDALAPMEKAAALSPHDAEAHYNLGITLQELGKLEAAEASYSQALRINPNFVPAHGNRGAVLHSMGRLEEAEKSLRRALQLKPDYAEACSNLGIVLHAAGKFEEAQTSYRNALKLKPDYATTHNNLGITLQKLGKLAEAEASYRQALALKPGYADVCYNLGNCLKESARPEEAETAYRQALQLKPHYVEAHFNLGNLLHGQKRHEEAEASYRKALEIKPDYAEALVNRGLALAELSRQTEAEESYRRALETNPNNVDAYFNLGNLMLELKRPADAEAHYRSALSIRPDHPEANLNLGRTLFLRSKLNEAGVHFWRALKSRPDYAEAYCDLGELLISGSKLQEAEESLRHAIRLKPELANAHSMLGVALKDQGRLNEAEASSRRALELKPDDASMLCGLANVLQTQGRLDEAEALFRKALRHQPENALIHSNLLFCIAHSNKIDTSALFADHLRFAEQFESPLKRHWQPHDNPRIAERTLQVGIVSGDFRNHAIANFIQPVLAHLANRPQLSLHAYANYPADDASTRSLRNFFAHWHPVSALNDDELAQKIRADGIDILIDLSGHTAYNRLLAFARKPAPVQISWMGYPATTGLTAMDYYFSDRFLLPEGMFDAQFTEKIVRLPANAPFLPFAASPPVNALPALTNGYVTFGSFNRLNKINHQSVAMWSELLRALPESRMLIAGLPEDGRSDVLHEWFAQEGIPLQRLDFHPRGSMETYVALHHQVDICLDTYPYNGGTTTLHALWMGVPTLSQAGFTAAGRTGAMILSHAGLEKFIAQNTADFIRKGAAFANDLDALSHIRANGRERFANSALGRPAVIAAGLEQALRQMWQRWCEGLPPASFEVSWQDMDGNTQEDANG